MPQSFIIIFPFVLCVLFLIFLEKNISVFNFSFKDGQNNSYIKNKTKIKYHVPKVMLEIYNNNKFNKTSPDVIRSVIPKHSGSFSHKKLIEEFSENHLLIFEIPKTSSDEKLINAELKILTIIEKSFQQRVEKKIELLIYDANEKTFVNSKNMFVFHSTNTWISFNVTKEVLLILTKNNNESNLKVVISVTSIIPLKYRNPNETFKLSLLPIDSNNLEHDYPVLLLSYTTNYTTKNTKILKRRKRNVEEDYEEETNKIWNDLIRSETYSSRKNKKLRNVCRRKPMYVDFSEIHYDEWIVQPSGYEAFQCQGKCFYPVADHLTPTKHAIIQALTHNINPLKAARSCCVPTGLDSISILYVDKDGVLTYRYAYRDMVVTECGCR